jgi:peptidoglycan/xylan/chitin deacetylase (PgdA/CDA1 family)
MRSKLRQPLAHVAASFLMKGGFVQRQLKTARSNNLITLVYFHNPSAHLFEGCIKWLVENGYQFISMDELYTILINAEEPPRRAICLSVDDGWRENLLNIIPIINAYSIHICFFISTEPVENGAFWWTYASRWEETVINNTRSVGDFKAIPDLQRQKEINKIKTCLALEREAMTKEEVCALSSNPLVTIGSHSVNHACLNRCTAEEQSYEIRESKRLLSEWTKKEIKYFSYPNGDAAGVEHAMLRNNGYLMAFTSKAEFLHTKEHDPFSLPRFAVNDYGSVEENICKMTGSWQKALNYIARKGGSPILDGDE